MSAKRKAKLEPVPLKIDIGCGKSKKEGFIGVDQYQMYGVDIVHDLRTRWPWKDSSVDEANCSHFIEHLTNLGDKWERVHFFNELYRVLKPGAKCTLAFPHWASNRWYGDPTHKEPFSEMGFYYLSRKWREDQAPATDKRWNSNGYACDFDWVGGYTMHPSLLNRNSEYQQYAIANYKEAAMDVVGTLTAKKDGNA